MQDKVSLKSCTDSYSYLFCLIFDFFSWLSQNFYSVMYISIKISYSVYVA